MGIKKILEVLFDLTTYINGVLATYEDKLWLRSNLILKEDFLKCDARIVNNRLYIQTI